MNTTERTPPSALRVWWEGHRLALLRAASNALRDTATRLEALRKLPGQSLGDSDDQPGMSSRTVFGWQTILATLGNQAAVRAVLDAGAIGNTLRRRRELPAGRRILVLAAHQDDETIGAAGTFLLCARAGAEFKIAYYTDGGTSLGRIPKQDVPEIRKVEARKVWRRIAGVEPIFWDYPNRSQLIAPDAASRLAKLIGDFSPEVIFLPVFIEQPVEHRRLNDVLIAANDVRTIDKAVEVWGYQITTRAPGNAVIDITSVWRRKYSINKLWRSQNAQIDYAHLAMGRDISASYYLKGADFKSRRAYAESFLAFSAPDYLRLAREFSAMPDSSARIDLELPTKREPDFFIIGMQKSGSYWLTALLDAHPSIRCFPSRPGGADGTGETHLFDILGSLGADQRRFRKSLSKKQGGFFADVVPKRDIAGAAEERAVIEAVRDRFNQFCHLQRMTHGKPIVGEKTTEYVHHLGLLQSTYPNAVKICILRDPRDRCVSFFFHQKRKGRLQENAKLSIKFVDEYLERVRRDYRGLLGLADPHFVLTYENLATDPAAAVVGILKALGLPQDDSIIGHMIEAAAFERLSGRAPGSVDEGSHFRKGTVGDWANHLTPRLAEHLVNELRTLTQEIEQRFALDLNRYSQSDHPQASTRKLVAATAR